MRTAAEEAGVSIVTGDTKVVPRRGGQAVRQHRRRRRDPQGLEIAAGRAAPGTRCWSTACWAIMGGDPGRARRPGAGNADRKRLPAVERVDRRSARCPSRHPLLRDATRGGVATVLNEFAASGTEIEIEETALLREAVKGSARSWASIRCTRQRRQAGAVSAEADRCGPCGDAAHPGRDATRIGRVVDGTPGRGDEHGWAETHRRQGGAVARIC